jgi:hypothetical protein
MIQPVNRKMFFPRCWQGSSVKLLILTTLSLQITHFAWFLSHVSSPTPFGHTTVVSNDSYGLAVSVPLQWPRAVADESVACRWYKLELDIGAQQSMRRHGQLNCTMNITRPWISVDQNNSAVFTRDEKDALVECQFKGKMLYLKRFNLHLF